MSAETIEKNDLTGLRIFTDGSKIDGKVGAALSCWKDGDEIMIKKFHLEFYCTVFQAELYALYHATDVALESTEHTVNILSDSRSALESIRSPNTYHPLAFMVREKLREAKDQRKDVRLFWNP
nr:uncharacterized protein LOC117993117 [Maniola hyperantus]